MTRDRIEYYAGALSPRGLSMAKCKSKCAREDSSVDVIELIRGGLSDVFDKWYELGTLLDVKRCDLDAIDKERGTAQCKMIHMLHKWRDSSISCSRMDVVNALRIIDQHQTAKKLLPSTDPTSELEANLSMFSQTSFAENIILHSLQLLKTEENQASC